MNEKTRLAHQLIRRGEGQNVEFKLKARHPEKIVREVVAFANSDGGHLFVGVNDFGEVIGLKYPEDEEYVLSKAIEELCKPSIEFEVDYIQIKDVEILHYQIIGGNNKPYFAFQSTEDKLGKSFVRVNDHSIQASYELRQILKRSNRNHAPIVFEERTKELFEYLEMNSKITVREYMEISGLNKKLASNKLVNLALSGALKIEPREGGDLFLPVE